MRRVLFLSLIIFFLTFIGLYSVTGAFLALALPVAIYLCAAYFLGAPEMALEFERELSTERAVIDLPVRVKVTVTNRGKQLDNLLIEDHLSPRLHILKGAPRHLMNLAPGETKTWEYTIAGRRGYFSFAAIQAVITDLFGLRTFQKTFITSGQLLILPQIAKLKKITIRPRKTRVYSGEIPARSGGSGVEFFGVREYQLGDSPGWINWRASARNHDHLYANEFEQERVSDVEIILDGRARSNFVRQGQSLFEYSVLAAATLSNAFIAQGDRVGLLHYGKFLKWTFPGYGKIQREKILRELTQVEPGKSLVFSYLQFIPIRIFPPQSQIVLISPLMVDDSPVLLQLRARGYRVMVITPDPIAFEHSFLTASPQTELAARILQIERQSLLRELIQGGVRVINWDVRQPFEQVVQELSQFPIITRSAMVAK
jgi:uncharacterized protein (DUF58 family)